MLSLKDRVTVVFSPVFTEQDDVVIGKMFMQEFTGGCRDSHTAPHVLVSHREHSPELIPKLLGVTTMAMLAPCCALATPTPPCQTTPST